MKNLGFQKLALIMAIWMLLDISLPAAALAASNSAVTGSRSTAIVPLAGSGSEGALVTEAARLLKERLSHSGQFDIVDAAKVREVLGYHAGAIRKEAKVGDAEKYLGLAKTHWFDRQYREAEATVNRAIDELRRQKDKGALLLDALLTKAVIYQETNRHAEAKKIFEEALKINPSLTMEGLPITGRSRRVFNRTHREIADRISGALSITSDPPVATVYLNGIKKGVTPLELKNLPEGSYLLTLEASHYGKVSQPVTVTANTTQFINRKLGWKDGQSGQAFDKTLRHAGSDPVAYQEIVKRAAQAGATLKVKNVILVGVERRKTGDLLVVRSVDTTLQASRHPVTIPLAQVGKDKAGSVEKIAANLSEQSKINVLKNPQVHLEPRAGSIRVLRRQMPFYKTPVFFTLVGLAVGAAAGTTAGLLITKTKSSTSSDAGGIDIQFE